MAGQPVDWAAALSTANSTHHQTVIHKHLIFNSLSSNNHTSCNLLVSTEALLQSDPIWLARWIISLFQLHSPSIQYSHARIQALIDALSQSTNLWLQQISHLDVCLKCLVDQESTKSELDDPPEATTERLTELIKENQEVAEACSAKWFAIQIEIKWKAYNLIYHHQLDQICSDKKSHTAHAKNQLASKPGEEKDEDETEHWGDLELDPIVDLEHPTPCCIPSFFSFHQSNLDELAQGFASQLELDRLRQLLQTGELDLDLFSIFDSIPLHARTSDLNYGHHLIALLPRPTNHLTNPPNATRTLLKTIYDPAKQTSPSRNSFTDQSLTHWYLSRVEAIDQVTGSIDTAIEIIQHGAASGVAGLESIAEDMSLLSKLIYDVDHSSAEFKAWTLEEWRSKSPDEIVQAYLSGSSPNTLVKDVHRLVLPYLSVLESRRARSSIPGAESTVPEALRTWALSQSNPLFMLEALINASSPTLKLPERLIKSNRDLAQILIACFYTSSSLEQWECMGRMFECMPAFPDHIPSSDEFNSANYLHELLSRRSGSDLWTPDGTRYVYEALSQLDAGRLSSILDGLDDHLTTAEVLARWNVPIKLGELVIRFHQNKASQQKLATKIARQEGGIEMESEEEWEVLLEAMIELSQPGRALDLLDKNQVTKLFFSGLLTSGKFKLARSLFSSPTCDSMLDTTIQEELVIAASREFYDNAETANLDNSEMKMAYDCLSVGPQTLNIKRERDFIEASCRLASFKLESKPGILMTPIEFRLKPNRLELISQLLQVNRTAYEYQDMIVDLVNKLGYGENLLAQIKALSMVVDFAIGERDLLAASLACERMISILERIKKRSSKSSGSNSLMVDEASEVIWKTCEKIGKYSGAIRWNKESNDLKGFKTRFLAHAMVICPSDQIPRLLLEWKAAEIEEDEVDKSNQYQDLNGSDLTSMWPSIELQRSKSDSVEMLNSSTPILNLALPGGDLASRTLQRAASLFPFNHNKTKQSTTATTLTPSNRTSISHTQLLPSSSSSPPPPTDPISNSNPNQDRNLSQERDFSQPLNNLLDRNDDHQSRFAVGVGTDRLTTALSNKFTSGVGWLIGASEEDLNS